MDFKYLQDALNRTIRECRPGFGEEIVTSYVYDQSSRLVSLSEFSGDASNGFVAKKRVMFEYDELSNPVLNVRDSNLNNIVDFNGTDKISSNVVGFVKINGIWWHETRQYEYVEDNSSEFILVSITKDRISDLGNTYSTIIGNAVMISETKAVNVLDSTATEQTFMNRNTKTYLNIRTMPSSLWLNIRFYSNGLNTVNGSSTGIEEQLKYDALGRMVVQTDGRAIR